MEFLLKKLIFKIIKIFKIIVLIFGGLRGTVSLALALIVYNSENFRLDPSDKILFFVSAMAFLTIISLIIFFQKLFIVNGSTTNYLIEILGLNKVKLV